MLSCFFSLHQVCFCASDTVRITLLRLLYAIGLLFEEKKSGRKRAMAKNVEKYLCIDVFIELCVHT